MVFKSIIQIPFVFREPEGPPPPPDSDYSYDDYNYYSNNYCEVEEVSLGGWNFQ